MKHEYCLNCGLEIEKADRAAGGWQHKGTNLVVCRATDATPGGEFGIPPSREKREAYAISGIPGKASIVNDQTTILQLAQIFHSDNTKQEVEIRVELRLAAERSAAYNEGKQKGYTEGWQVGNEHANKTYELGYAEGQAAWKKEMKKFYDDFMKLIGEKQ